MPVNPSKLTTAILSSGGASRKDGTPYVSKMYLECLQCGGPLPCIECSQRMRAVSGETGKEPTDVSEGDLQLSEEVAAAARAIQEGWTSGSKRSRKAVQSPPVRPTPVHMLGTERVSHRRLD